MDVAERAAVEAAEWANIWASRAFWVAVVSVFVNIVGIGLVWRQLRLNQAALTSAAEGSLAAANAARAALLDSRPWLDASLELKPLIVPHLRDERTWHINITLRAKNLGRTPAVKVVTGLFAVDENSLDQVVVQIAKSREMFADVGRALFPDAELEMPESITISGCDFDDLRSKIFVAAVSYQTAGDNVWHLTPLPFIMVFGGLQGTHVRPSAYATPIFLQGVHVT